MKKVVHFFVLFLCCGVWAAGFDQVQQDQDRLAEYLEIIGHQKFSNDNALNRAVSAIAGIESMPYSDIPDILMALTIQELVNGRQKKRVIQGLLSAVRNRVTVEHIVPENTERIPKLIELETRLFSIIGGNDFNSHRATFVQLMGDAIEKAKDRPNSLHDKLFPGLDGDLEAIKKSVSLRKFQKKAQESSGSDEVRKTEMERAKDYKRFRQELLRLAPQIHKSDKEIKAGSSSPAELVYAGTTRFLTDEVAQNIVEDKHFRILGREDIAERLLLVLSRYKQQNAVLVGSKGAGKTSILELLAEKVVLDLVGANEVTDFLKDSIILQTSTGKISGLAKTDKPSGQAQAMEEYFRAVKEIQERVNRRIIIFIDEIHTLTSAQIEAIKPILDSSHGGILLVGASTSPELRISFKHNEAFLRRIQQIAVRELSEPEMMEIFRNSWLPTFRKRHGEIEISEEIMRLVLKKAPMVYPDKGALDAAFILTDDLLTYMRFQLNDREAVKKISSEEVYSFIQREIGLPIDPSQVKELEAYRSQLSKELNHEVLENERMVEEILDLWIDLLKNESSRGIRVAAILGRSGTGKSEVASQLALRALGSKERMFVIDANEYRDANDIKLGILFGVPGGVGFSQVTSGTLMEWMDDPSRGKHAGIIVINEADKANELFWVRFMEFFDTGRVQGGDNKTRIAHKHLVILTSNRGDRILFPEDVERMAEETIRNRVYNISEEEIRRLLEDRLDARDVNNLPDSIVNRVDLFTISNLISPRIAKVIAERIVLFISEEYKKTHGIEVSVDTEVVDWFVEAYHPLRRGARPLVRSLGRYLNTGIGRLMGRPEVYVESGGVFHVRLTSEKQVEFKYGEHALLKAPPILDNVAVQVMTPVVTCSGYFK